MSVFAAYSLNAKRVTDQSVDSLNSALCFQPYSPENLSKDEDEEEPAISEELRRKIEMDDPGIDLSVFKPLGKRKCVIEMEERKGKPWYEGNDASDEETPEPNCKFFDLLSFLRHLFSNDIKEFIVR